MVAYVPYPKKTQQVNSTHMLTSSYELVASCNLERCSGHFKSKEKYLKVNVLELKAAHFGLKQNTRILLNVGKTSTIAIINKMGSLLEIWD